VGTPSADTMITRERSGSFTAGSRGQAKPFSTMPATATGRRISGEMRLNWQRDHIGWQHQRCQLRLGRDLLVSGLSLGNCVYLERGSSYQVTSFAWPVCRGAQISLHISDISFSHFTLRLGKNGANPQENREHTDD
jgi:hypothetical protein